MAARRGIPHVRAFACPKGWRVVQQGGDGAAFVRDDGKLRVITSTAIEEDGKRWLHVSVSKPKWGEPTWAELVGVKEAFIGTDRRAIQVLPPRSQHVNIAEVWHWYSCLDDDGLPDFSRGLGSI